jgi:hypothetical protein
MSSWTSAVMRGSRLAIERGVNVRAISARSTECRGGSMKMSQSSGSPPGGAARELKTDGSCSARFTLS